MEDNENKVANQSDERSEAIAMRCVKICEDKKASNIKLFHVADESILADYYLVLCGNSLAHIRALAENLRRTLIDEGIKPRGQDGSPNSQWIILDYGIILVHIMTPEMRRRYCLEDLWDKRMIVYEGGEEMPEASEVSSIWDSEDDDKEFGDEDFEDEDGEFEDNEEFEDDEDGEFEGDEDGEFEDEEDFEDDEDGEFDDEDLEDEEDDEEEENDEEEAPEASFAERRRGIDKLFGEAPAQEKGKRSPRVNLDDLFKKK